MEGTKLLGDLTYSSPNGTTVLAHGNQKANGHRDTTSTGARHVSPISCRQDLDVIGAVLPSQVSHCKTPKT